MAVYLKGGHVIGFGLPLSEQIVEQWKRGMLVRVTADGEPWPDGGDYTDLGQPEPGADSASDDEPGDEGDGDAGAGSDDNGDGGQQAPELKRPRKNGSRQAWADYAVALGVCTADEAADLSREQLIDLCVPDEEKPSDPAE